LATGLTVSGRIAPPELEFGMTLTRLLSRFTPNEQGSSHKPRQRMWHLDQAGLFFITLQPPAGRSNARIRKQPANHAPANCKTISAGTYWLDAKKAAFNSHLVPYT